jgi:ABC-2 type transport system ATP-binding protein
MTAAAPVLAVTDAQKRYGRITALDGVSLHVAPGELVALLGPNGAGKSTLFQLLTGLFVPDAGRIEVAGFDLRDAPVAALRHIGVVFQQPTLDLDLGVVANLSFFCRLQGLTGAESGPRIRAALARAGLADRARDRARNLSGGNRRKLELIRALLHRPRVLLLDEPTVGLDPASRADLLEQVLALCAEQSVGVLWATHLVEEAERAARVLVLHQGRLLAEGPPAALTSAHGASGLAEAFLGLTGAENGRTSLGSLSLSLSLSLS